MNENPWTGFEVVSTYTRAQALEDGVLVDLSSLAREAGFRWPLAVTQAVWVVLEPSAARPAAVQTSTLGHCAQPRRLPHETKPIRIELPTRQPGANRPNLSLSYVRISCF